ncbi:hypothetical protein BWQ96_05218 [Gracilariopsis chorda]|uniref:Uncharacterized protein n=1 Tax=Gracilariopsis chorda TaxID=448386 RepID=A0A2V3ISB2_9FLOR|nr:hypothetical protein BWQ96_05218 [Gracilariopsis chorda]|eukprot:PXF45015.1 hypothetical protein BWQ96_05218 [Gracilariopsis chorda]
MVIIKACIDALRTAVIFGVLICIISSSHAMTTETVSVQPSERIIGRLTCPLRRPSAECRAMREVERSQRSQIRTLVRNFNRHAGRIGNDCACAVMFATCFAPTGIGGCAACAALCAQVNTFAQTAAVRSSGRAMATACLGKLGWNNAIRVLDTEPKVEEELAPAIKPVITTSRMTGDACYNNIHPTYKRLPGCLKQYVDNPNKENYEKAIRILSYSSSVCHNKGASEKPFVDFI